MDLGQPGGGSFLHVVEVIHELIELGWDITLIGLYTIKPMHLRCRWVGRPFSRARFLGPFLDLFNIFLLLHALKKAVNTRIIYVRWGSTALSACLFAELSGTPYYIEMNGIYHLVESNRKTALSRFKSHVLRFIERFFLSRAKGVFTTTSQMAEYYIAKYGLNPNTTLPNACGVNPNTHSPTLGPMTRDLKPGAPAIGYAGGLWRATGVGRLIEAAPLILKEYPNAVFLLAGVGEDAEHFKKMTSKNGHSVAFRFLGLIPYNEIPSFLEDVDIAVAPYQHSEALERIGGGTPTKIYTYLACGKITVISDLPYYQHFRQCPACLFFNPSDPQDLARVICEALTLPKDKVEYLAHCGRQFILDHYTWRRNAQSINSTLKSHHVRV